MDLDEAMNVIEDGVARVGAILMSDLRPNAAEFVLMLHQEYLEAHKNCLEANQKADFWRKEAIRLGWAPDCETE